jgi:hypothetical protein
MERFQTGGEMPENADVETIEAEKDLPEDHPVLKALRAEREARKRAEAQIEGVRREADTFVELKSRFPFVEKDDFKGLTLEEWEVRAQRLASLQGTTATEQPKETLPEEKVLAQAATLSQGTPAVQSATISFEEAKKMGGYRNPEVRDLIARGLVEGVEAPRR